MSDSPHDESAPTTATTTEDEQEVSRSFSQGRAGETTVAAVPPPPPPPPPPLNYSSPAAVSSRSRTMTPTQQIMFSNRGLDVVDQQGSSSDAPDMPRTPRDDNSRYQFMSEPSVSEDGSDRIIAPHRLPAGPNAFRRMEGENDGMGNYRSRQYGSVPNSPGNTSLSSWDTNSPGRVVQLHFSSAVKVAGIPSLPPVTIESRNGERRVRVQNLLPRRSGVSESPESHEQDEDVSFGPPSLPKIHQNGEYDEGNIEGTAEEQEGVNHLNSEAQREAVENSAISINMALSDSEDDNDVDDIGVSTSRTLTTGSENGDEDEGLLDWEAQQDHSADDERTPTQPPLHHFPQQPPQQQQQQQQPSTTPSRRTTRPHNHRRTRSGDAAAASLATGGNDWKGMTKDKIPIPEAIDDETDDDSSTAEPSSSKNKKSKNGDRQTSLGNFEQHLQMLFAQGNSARPHMDQQQSPQNVAVQQNKVRRHHESNQQRQFTVPYSERQRSRQKAEQQRLQSSSQVPSKDQESSSVRDLRQSLPNVYQALTPSSEKQTVELNLQRQRSEPNVIQKSPHHHMERHGYGFNQEMYWPHQFVYQHSPQQQMERQRFQQNVQRHFIQYSGERHVPEQQIEQQSSHQSIEAATDQGDATSMSPFESMTPPPPPSYLAQIVAGSPSVRQIPGSPLVARHPQTQVHNGIGGPVPLVVARYPNSPVQYPDPSPRSFGVGLVAPFSPSGSIKRESGASFPIVEDVDEDRDSSEYSDGDQLAFQDQKLQHQVDGGLSQSQPTIVPSSHIPPPPSESPFANLGKRSTERALRSSFMPIISTQEDLAKYPTYVCPRCKTRQREFFTISDAPRALNEPSNYLAFYFGIYVIASLFIFGLEEGWKPLDCVYFAVITLTTAGLGDYVPTTDANKIICSIFIYFGVACIGLLLGSYIASMLDDRAYRDAKKKQMDSCPNCARIMSMNEKTGNLPSSRQSVASMSPSNRSHPIHLSLRNINSPESRDAVYVPRHHQNRSGSDGSPRHKNPNAIPRTTEDLTTINGMPSIDEQSRLDETSALGNSAPAIPPPPPVIPEYASPSPGVNHNILGSPMTRQILGRQKHTRHASMDISNVGWNPRTRKFSADLPTIHTTPPTIDQIPMNPPLSAPNPVPQVPFAGDGQGTHSLRGSAFAFDEDNSFLDDEDDYSDDEDESCSTESTIDEIVDEKISKLKAAKYVFLTLRQALVNSMVIIAVGCVGFILTEEFSIVDSWYFTTVFLTTVGFGDIVPITNGGKLFATVYILVAGTVLINNMSMISMIPLELRRRRIERAVLTQFGDQLDDAALRELATGPLIQRLSLSANRADGLDECTREMFSLAMLVRLGKVTEDDIRETFAAFRRLDVNNEGVLNSKSIIAGMIQKHRSQNLQLGRRRQSSSNLSTMDRNANSMGQFSPYWQMPQLPLTTPSPPVGYEEPLIGLASEQPLSNTTEQFMATQGQCGSSFPTETTSLLQPTI